jgi:hypothetical protein
MSFPLTTPVSASLPLRDRRLRLRPHVAGAALAFLLGACSGPGATTVPATASLGPRPASPATVEIVQPAASSTVSGATVHVVLKLTGAKIVTQTSTDIRPDEGHVHLYVNNQLVSMNYGLEQELPVTPGTIVLKAEFVAADHAPFSPRVWSNEVIFTVTSAGPSASPVKS